METVHKLIDALLSDWSVATWTSLLALLLTIICTPLVRRLASRLGAIDAPGGRHIHTRPTPRLGGLSVLTGVVGSLLLSSAFWSTTPESLPSLTPSLGSPWHLAPILGIALLVCLFGAVDDLVRISPIGKLGGLTVAAVLLVAAGIKIDFVTLPGVGDLALGWLAIPATIIWVLATTNAVNLIDGVDGVGPGVVSIAAGALMLFALGQGDPASAWLYGATSGAAGGFLLFNRQPASIFLGDSGSLLLGFLIAATAAAGCTGPATATILVAALLALAVPFLDAVQSFVRRFRAEFGRGTFSTALQATAIADRDHIHHRLLFRGLAPNRVALTLGLVTTLTSLIALLLLPGTVDWGATVSTTVVATLVLLRLGTITASPPARTPTSVSASTDNIDAAADPAAPSILIPTPPATATPPVTQPASAEPTEPTTNAV